MTPADRIKLKTDEYENVLRENGVKHFAIFASNNDGEVYRSVTGRDGSVASTALSSVMAHALYTRQT